MTCLHYRTAPRRDPGVFKFKYFCTSMTTGMKVEGSRFRHELLELKGVKSLADIDKNIPRVSLKKPPSKLYRVEGTGDRALYNPDDEWDLGDSD